VVARSGRLTSPEKAPADGEQVAELARLRWDGRAGVEGAGAGTEVVVEQILSGRVPTPVRFQQDHDEWVLVVHGRAELAVSDTRFQLGAGDWLLLPAGVPHELLAVEPGTSWLAVHGPLPGR
jgi:cupin 2 domain-containing protein